MRKFFTVAAVALLAACSSSGTLAPPAALTPTALQTDAATALYDLQAVGCVASELGAAAAPIVSIAADAKGNQVLAKVDTTGATICSMTVPATALPTPVPANAAPTTVAVPAAAPATGS